MVPNTKVKNGRIIQIIHIFKHVNRLEGCLCVLGLLEKKLGSGKNASIVVKDLDFAIVHITCSEFGVTALFGNLIFYEIV